MRAAPLPAESRGRLIRRIRLNRLLKHMYYTSGTHYWELHVARMGKSQAVVVGVAPTEAFEGETLNGPLGSWVDGAIGYAATGVIIKSGVEIGRARAYAEGDTVGVLLEMNYGRVTFFLNGECVAGLLPVSSPGAAEPPQDAAAARWRKLGAFQEQAMFAAITFSPDSDEVDIYPAARPC